MSDLSGRVEERKGLGSATAGTPARNTANSLNVDHIIEKLLAVRV